VQGKKGGHGGDQPLLYRYGDRRMEGAGSGVERRRVEEGEGGGGNTVSGAAAPQCETGERGVTD
jgi:hypothetical protein